MTSRGNSLPSSNNIISEALKDERYKQRSHPKVSHYESTRKSTSCNTTISVTNCFKVAVYITLYLLTGCYFILWVVACNDAANRCFKKKWKIAGKKYDIPHRLIYSITGSILHLCLIIICLTFLLKYLIYSHDNRIQEKIKKAVRRNEKTLHKFQKQANGDNSDMYEFFLRHYRKDKEKQDLFKLSAKPNNQCPHTPLSTAKEEEESCCYPCLTHMKISWIILTELLLSLFYIEYNEFNIMAMAALSYYVFSAILYFNIDDAVQRDEIMCNGHTYNVVYSDQIFFAAACLTKAFAIILPGVCINICQKWKCVYNEYYSPPEMSVTFKGDKFENASDSLVLNNNAVPVLDRSAKPFIALRSVLNDVFIRCWIFMLFAVELIMFVVHPIANHADYRDALNDQYNCKCVDVECVQPMQCKKESLSFFIVNELILRLFVPMTLISTLILVLSFEQKFFISRLDAIRYVISPSSISAILVLTLCELYWWEDSKNGIVTIWSVVYGITAVLQLYIFVALLDIQDNAYRNRDRLYGFKKSQPLTYYLEGVVAIGMIMICLTAFILDDNLDNGQIDKTYIIVRGVGMLLFDLIELVMLIPIRTIAISPKFKKHFQKKGRKKYLRTFRWICFVNICNITYSTIFICDQFQNVLTDYNILSTSSMRSAFTFSFGSIYFSIWGLSQLLPWIIPSDFESSTLYTYNPGIEQHSEISYMTQYHQVDKSRLGVGINGINSNCISPPPSNLLSDLDSSLKYKLNRRHCAQEREKGDLSSLKIIESPTSNTKKTSRKRPKLKERKINISFDENEDGGSNCFGIEKYEDVIKMFQAAEAENNKHENDNNNNQQ